MATPQLHLATASACCELSRLNVSAHNAMETERGTKASQAHPLQHPKNLLRQLRHRMRQEQHHMAPPLRRMAPQCLLLRGLMHLKVQTQLPRLSGPARARRSAARSAGAGAAPRACKCTM